MKSPDYYEPDLVGTLYRPRISDIITAANSMEANPAAEDDRRILLLLVDPQVDFVHEDGSLSVPGAVADAQRTVEWLYHNLEKVTDIVTSLDSHYPLHIFYPGWWVDASGRHPQPMTPITAEEVDNGHWLPTIEKEWSRDYVHELERRAKKTLLIWPYHTMIGTFGHSITPALYEAMVYHAEARRSRLTYVIKGRIAKTEHYSLLEPEVKVPEEEEGRLNAALLERMGTYDLIYIAGQAKSHCVLETITSIVNQTVVGSGLVEKLRLLTDCTSSVAHPDIDFEALARKTYDRFEDLGLKRVTSADPVS